MIDLAAIPRDGTEVRVKIGTKFYTGAWACNIETGEPYFGVRLAAGGDWVRVALDTISGVKPVKAATGNTPPPAAQPALAPPPLPVARKRDALIAPEEVAARITVMVRTLRAQPDIEARFLTAGGRVNWPAMIYTSEDLRAQAENQDNADSAARPPRHKATPADIARLDETWGWFCQLSPLPPAERAKRLREARSGKAKREAQNGLLLLSYEQRLVWRRALGDSFSTISKDTTGEHHETIRRRHDRAIGRLAAIAERDLESRIAARRATA